MIGPAPVSESPDLDRILELPSRPPFEEGSERAEVLCDMMTARLRLPDGPCMCPPGRCIKRLKMAQAWALYEASQVGGILGPIGVGHGKTILDILAPMVLPDCRQVVLLIPSGLREQLIREYEAVAQHFRVPSLVLGTYGRIVPGVPTVHVLPFSKFSRADCTDVLEQLAPDTIIIDEAHRCKNRRTSTTGRVLRYFYAHPRTRLLCWSGTLTSKSIKDYAHLSAFALREGSPLPLHSAVTEEWASCLDPSDWRAPPGALTRLGTPLYEAFSRRLLWTRGVISTKTAAVSASINLLARVPPALPGAVSDALDEVRKTWQRPDGEELIEAIEVSACARQVACGMYLRWKFPRGEPPALIDEWFAVRKAWHKELRERLRDRQPHLDSPLLLTKAAIRHEMGYSGELPVWESEMWTAWRDIRTAVYHETDVVWIDDYLARDAAEWARKNRGIVWTEHTAFGERVADLAGIPYFGAGTAAEIAAESGNRSIVASIHAHGTGRDGLQRLFRQALIVSPPAGADAWEQVIGRLHRIGQDADEVDIHTYQHVPEFKDALYRAQDLARYVAETLGTPQKLLMATQSW